MTAESLDGWNVERDVLFSFVIDEKKNKGAGEERRRSSTGSEKKIYT